MRLAFDPAYAYARSCGELARSFLGERAAGLASCARVAEAWRMIFRDEPPALPEALLAAEAERRLDGAALDSVSRILGTRKLEEPLLLAIDRRREMSRLKRILAAAGSGQGLPQWAQDDARDWEFSIEHFPDAQGMLRGTRYAWIAEAASLDLPSVKLGLDRQYFREMLEIAASSSRYRASPIASLIRLEAELANVVWSLRLKRYYSIGEDRARELLIELPGADASSAALKAISFRHDARSDWKGWKWERLVPDMRDAGTGAWRLDLRALEASASAFLYRRLVRALHLGSDTLAPLYCLMRIKEMETTALRGILEGIRLEAPQEEVGAYVSELAGGVA